MTKLQKSPRVCLQFVFHESLQFCLVHTICLPYGLSTLNQSVQFVSVRFVHVGTIRLPYGLSADLNCYIMLHHSSCFEHFSLNNFIIRKLWQGRGGAGQATTPAVIPHLRNQNVSRAIFLIFKQLANNWQTIGKQLANNWKFIHQSNKGSS